MKKQSNDLRVNIDGLNLTARHFVSMPKAKALEALAEEAKGAGFNFDKGWPELAWKKLTEEVEKQDRPQAFGEAPPPATKL